MLYGTKQAAEYIGISVSALKYHIYQGHIRPTTVGHSLVFSKKQLDHFISNRRPPGRPRKPKRERILLP